MQRVLVTERLADSGLAAMSSAGLEVDVRLGLSPDELLDAVQGAAALVIRSATQVTADVLAAGTDLVVVGRAGIGVDNIDIETATRQGVMVVNAPNSIALANAEHTMAMLLSMARNIPQASRDLHEGEWNKDKWGGVELNGKTLGIVGLGRVGVLVAQRAHAFGMQIVARDPYVSADRSRQLGVELVSSIEELVERADFLCVLVVKTPETVGMISADVLKHAKPSLRLVNTGRGGIVDEDALADAIREGRIAGAALDVFEAEPTTKSPLFELDSVVVTPHLGASTIEAQDKAGQTIAEQVVLALRGDFVPFAVNVAATEANANVQPFMPLAERLGRLFTALAGGVVDTLEISYEGEIAGYDCRVLTLAILKGVLEPVTEQPVSFVNGPQLAAERGLIVREISSSSARDYVNLVELRGRTAERSTHVAGTLYGKQDAPRIVAIDDHIVDIAPSSHMLVVSNNDTPGMVGIVGTFLGADGINIKELDLGTGPTGDAALMVLSTSIEVPPAVVDQLRAQPGIVGAQAIELG
jgi:D-3-phosphoglycerate dehydrogenase